MQRLAEGIAPEEHGKKIKRLLELFLFGILVFKHFFGGIIILSTMSGDEIGYSWLAARYKVRAIQPLPVESRIGLRRQTHQEAGRRVEYYTEAMRPQASLGAHLAFALKHEGVALEFLARLFAEVPAEALGDWISSEPTGE
ncbi:MAG: hypothetical protein HLUCCX14_07415 [Marinobacter excellens HL-55]|uniref:Uncharacterized protein n=1 Tax=Marinobacter excellens HL-55 TaxID=1305731 RepID=A0A0P7YHJ5_9GAMM|nr:MAG: hypothetical protein HLUCCX14_07415 [Marinobacter excellens HL-55]